MGEEFYVMSRRYGKKGEYAENETENYSSTFTIVYNKDITYGISKPNVHKAYIRCFQIQLYNNKKGNFSMYY